MSTELIKKKEKKINISQNLRSLRKSKDITIRELHEATNIKINTLKEYETKMKLPSLSKIIDIATYFSVSIDFLLMWDKTNYPKNLLLISLSRKIDKMDQVKRFQIESTANSLLGTKPDSISFKLDISEIQLTKDLNVNMKLLRQNKGLLQKEVASHLDVIQNQISFYEKGKQIPPPKRLIKLSEIFGISIHALVTGKKLYFDFINKSLEKTILKADQDLLLADKNILIRLMQRIIEDSD